MIPDGLPIEPSAFGDDRGFVLEIFNPMRFAEATGVVAGLVRDGQFRSALNVPSGLHYPVRQPRGKPVRVVAGEVFEVAADIRRDSPHSGPPILSAKDRRGAAPLSGVR